MGANNYGAITYRERSLQGANNDKKSKSHHYIKKLIDNQKAIIDPRSQ